MSVTFSYFVVTQSCTYLLSHWFVGQDLAPRLSNCLYLINTSSTFFAPILRPLTITNIFVTVSTGRGEMCCTPIFDTSVIRSFQASFLSLRMKCFVTSVNQNHVANTGDIEKDNLYK